MPERRRRGRRLAAAAVLTFAMIAGSAGASEWQAAALWGADVRSLVFAPLRPDVALAGTSSGQVYRSEDGGSTWSTAGAPLPFPGWVVGVLLFDPDRPERLWAGLRGVFGGGMVAWSEDYGAQWAVAHPPASLEDRSIYALAVSAGRIYAGTRAGVLRSDDDAYSWTLVSAGTPTLINVSSLWVDPGEPDRLIAGTWRRAYRSEDRGDSWRGIFDGMVEDTDVFSLHSVAGKPGALWASTCGWVYETSDRGGAWQRRRDGLAERRTPSFAVLGGDAGDERLLAGTVAGAYLSTDGGGAWKRTTDADLSVLAIAHHPARPLRVLLGTEGAGVWRSDDGGHHFRPASEGLRNVRVAAMALHAGTVWVAVNHAGPAGGLYRSADGGRGFERVLGGLPTVLELAASGDALWAATEAGLFRVDPSGSAVERQTEIGPRRVDQVEAVGARVVARAGGEVFERNGAGFHSIVARSAPKRTPVASIALTADALWVSDETGLVRIAADERRSIAAPETGGHLEPAGQGLALNGGEVLWLRADLRSPWVEAATGHPRVLPTSDARWPLLVIAGVATSNPDVRLAEPRAGGWNWRPVELGVPAADVLAAAVVGDRLLLATSGHGVLSRSIAPAVAVAASR